MRLFSKPLVCCALFALLGTLQSGSAQTGTGPKKHLGSDPAAQALNQLLAAAQAAFDKQDYATAAQNYQDYLAKKPDDAVVHYDLGYAYTAMRRPADAKTEYEKAISLDPKMAAAYLNLGITLLESDPGAAVDPLQHAAALMSNQARPKFLLGVALERTGKLPAAIEQYQAADKIDAKDFETHLALGRALVDAGRASDAEPELRSALELRPDAAQVHFELARSLVEQKKLEAGASELATYLQAAPNDTAVRVQRAAVLVDLAKEDDALAELDRAAAAGPESLRALKLRYQIYWDEKRYNDVIPVLQRAAALAPQVQNIPALLGHAYLEKKLYPDAIKELATAYRMDPNANDVIADLIAAEYAVKNYAAALQSLDVLSKRKDLPAGSWFIRASCYDNLGQLQEALDAYKQFLQLNKDENNDMYFVSTERVRVLTRELREKKR